MYLERSVAFRVVLFPFSFEGIHTALITEYEIIVQPLERLSKVRERLDLSEQTQESAVARVLATTRLEPKRQQVMLFVS